MMNYYQLLQIPSNATPQELKQAFRKAAKTCHPDLFQGSDPQEQQKRQKQFVRITQAYEVLNDPLKRRDYDRQLAQASTKKQKPSAKTSSSSQGFQKPKGPSAPHSKAQSQAPPFTESSGTSLEDLLSDVNDLLHQLGVPFKDPLEILVEWAKRIFQQLTSEEEPPTQSKSKPKASQKKHSPLDDIEEELQRIKKQFKQGQPRSSGPKTKVKEPSRFQEVEAEFEALKRRYR